MTPVFATLLTALAACGVGGFYAWVAGKWDDTYNMAERALFAALGCMGTVLVASFLFIVYGTWVNVLV